MALETIKIAELPSVSQVVGDDYLVVEQPDKTKKATISQVISDLDLANKGDLSATGGASLIGTSDGTDVQQSLDTARANERELWRRALHDLGLTLVEGSFEDGATLTYATDVIWHMAGAQCYTWSGTFPKTVPAGSTPGTTGGASASTWATVGGLSLLDEVTEIKNEAVEAKDQAEDARDEAQAYALQASELGNLYASVSEGLAATTDGQYFQVPQGNGSSVSFKLYKNNAGIAQDITSVPSINSITKTIRLFSDLASAQAEVDSGTVVDGGYILINEVSANTASVEYKNIDGVLQPTGRSFPTMEAIVSSIKETPSGSIVTFVDDDNNALVEITEEGYLKTPTIEISNETISSGDISIYPDVTSSSLLFLDEDNNVLFDSSEITSGGDPVDPGDVTVDLPPQSAAYNLLSKMRSALEDVCIIINSDSTGITQDTDPATGQVFKKWTRKLAEFLAANYPAYTVNYYTWGSGAYNSPETIQIGTAGKTLHFYNAAVAGTQPLYLMGQYFETAYVPRQADLIILNHGHNTDNNVPASTHMGMDLVIMYSMLQRHPNAGAIMISQNPLRDSDNGTTRSSGSRQAAITAGFSLVDVFQLFQNAGKPTGWYMDNIHPNATGDDKIFDLVKNLFVWPANQGRFTPGLIDNSNLIGNGDFSDWEDTLQSPTGWTLVGCTAEKDTTNFESGSYGLRLNQTGTVETYASSQLPSSLVKRLRGKTVVLSARVFIPTTSTRGNCGSVQIAEITNNRPYGTPIGGRGGFVWKSTVVSIPTTATALTIRAVLDTSGGAAGNWCTFDRISLVVGNIPQDFY